MAEERGRAGGQPIGTRLEEDHKVADFGLGQNQVIAKDVQRCAQAPDDRDHLFGSGPHSIADRDRVIPSDGLAEIAGCGELMMQAAVDDEIGPASRLLPVDHPRDVDAALADDVSTELHDDTRSGEVGLD